MTVTNQQLAKHSLVLARLISCLGRSYTSALDTDMNGRMQMTWMSLAYVGVVMTTFWTLLLAYLRRMLLAP